MCRAGGIAAVRAPPVRQIHYQSTSMGGNSMARSKTTEEQLVADAPIVEGDNTTNESATAPTEGQDAEREALIERATALIQEQFGGEDGAPKEGVTAWPEHIRQVVLDADRLEVEYRQTLAMKEANRTILRAFATMKQLPQDVADLYYKPTKRGKRGQNGASNS